MPNGRLYCSSSCNIHTGKVPGFASEKTPSGAAVADELQGKQPNLDFCQLHFLAAVQWIQHPGEYILHLSSECILVVNSVNPVLSEYILWRTHLHSECILIANPVNLTQ